MNKKIKIEIIVAVILGIAVFGALMLWKQNHLNISQAKAAEIVFTDLSKQYGNVLQDHDFSKAHWTAVKERFKNRLVWIVTLDQLTRLDFPSQIQGSWGVVYWVDIQTGGILQIAYYS
jgi:hypothetical protein